MDFPPDFLFGTASAAYQIEGAVSEDGRGPSIWDAFARRPGATVHGDAADIACDHYHRVESDLDLLQQLGVDAYRFSVAWSRVLPDGRRVEPRGLDFYDRMLDGVLARGIVPMVTLYHWDLPQALEDEGGWPERETAHRLAEFAAVVGNRLGDRVAHWVTINEPWCAAFLGHLYGVHAPGVRDLRSSLAAAHHLLLGHGLATRALHELGATSVGPTLNLSDVHAASDEARDLSAAARVDGHENRWFLDPIRRGLYPDDMLDWYSARTSLDWLAPGDLDVISTPIDFLGVNVYERHVVAHDAEAPFHQARKLPVPQPRTAGDCAVSPESLTSTLIRVHREYGAPPVFVTENGAAYHDYVDPEGRVNDLERVDYLRAYLEALEGAIDEGVDVRGYFAWSFMDVFEWALGYSIRFGLIYNDYATQHRTLKSSAMFYRDMIRGVRAATSAGD